MKKLSYFVLILFLFSCNIYACECIGTSSIKSAIHSSDIIIDATVIRENKVDQKFQDSTGVYFKEYIVKVNKVFKGTIVHDIISIYTGLGDGGDCGYTFAVGSRYIIYTVHTDFFKSSDPYHLYTDECMRTRLYSGKEKRVLKRMMQN